MWPRAEVLEAPRLSGSAPIFAAGGQTSFAQGLYSFKFAMRSVPGVQPPHSAGTDNYQ